MPDPSKYDPQIGVRFPKPEMERLRQHAQEHYAGNVSVMVKMAVRKLIDAEQRNTARELAEHDVVEREEQVA